MANRTAQTVKRAIEAQGFHVTLRKDGPRGTWVCSAVRPCGKACVSCGYQTQQEALVHLARLLGIELHG